ncbi:MAG: SAF domain-containing protein [Ilumatobacteraceae bacterium]
MSRRRTRIWLGLGLAAAAVGGNVLLYSSIDDRIEVVQVVDNIRAGQVVTSADLRIVEVDLDPTVPSVAASDIATVIDQYARVYIASGTLMASQLVQPRPLVTPGTGVVAIEIRPTRLPSGLRERSKVLLVVLAADADAPPFVTTGRVVARDGTADDSAGVAALSVEVAVEDAPSVAAGDDVRVVVLDPEIDPAMETSG